MIEQVISNYRYNMEILVIKNHLWKSKRKLPLVAGNIVKLLTHPSMCVCIYYIYIYIYIYIYTHTHTHTFSHTHTRI